MPALALFLHLFGATLWLGGMGFVLLALRPAAFAELEPPLRQRLLLAALGRFFPLVWTSIALLWGSGVGALANAGAAAPRGWHAMAAVALVMTAVFAHVYFAPYRRARRAAAAEDWALVGKSLQQIHPLVRLNFALGWVAVALVLALP